MNAQTNVVSISTKIAEYSQTAAALVELSQRYAGVVYEVGTKAGMDAAKAGRKELRALRIALEEKRKELKAPALLRSKLIDEEAKAITEKLVELEQPIALQIELEEKRAERERQARIEAEEKRVGAIQARVQAIRNDPTKLVGCSASTIETALGELREMKIGADFEEFQREAQDALTVTIATLTTMLAGAKAQEAEAVRVAAERAELEKLRKEAAERAAREESERKARIAAEDVSRKAQQEREDAERKAEHERLDREAAENREAQQKAFGVVADAIAETQRPDSGRAVVGAGVPFAMPIGTVGVELDEAIAVAGAITQDTTRERIYYGALVRLSAIVMPGSEEDEIIKKAFADAGVDISTTEGA